MEKKTERSKQKPSQKSTPKDSAEIRNSGEGATAASSGYSFGTLKKFDLSASLDAPGAGEAWDDSDPFLDRPPLYFT